MNDDLRALTDEKLLIRCRRASADTARTIIGIIAERFNGPLYSYLYKMVQKRAVAEDLLQETMLRLYRNRRRYREVAKCSTWLYRIATNLALNEIRNAKRKAHLSINAPMGDDGAEFSTTFKSKEEGPVEALVKKDTQRIVNLIIGEIPEKYRSVLLLCDIESFSYQEAADTLDIELGTVRSRLSRARDYFQKKFAPYIKELETK